jgi:hypothetical protein
MLDLSQIRLQSDCNLIKAALGPATLLLPNSRAGPENLPKLACPLPVQ